MRRAENFEDDPDEDSMDDDSDDSGESDSEDGGKGGLSGKAYITKLEVDVAAAPFDADSHAALISAVREAANLDRLRVVRRRAAAKVPLPESLWLEWLQDEKNLSDDADFEELDKLHEMACIACPLSSRIWLARYALLQDRPSDQSERVRAIFEAALSVLGVHPTEGLEIWAEYRNYEETLFHELDGKPPDVQKGQVHRVRALFLRQLALPLPGLERLREAFITFDKGLDASLRDPMAAAKADAIMAEGAEGWQQRDALEKRLLEASRPSVSIAATGSVDTQMKGAEISAEILVSEEASGDHPRIFLAHLRAIHWAPFSEERWRNLLRFVAGTMKDAKQLVNILECAVRNCPQCQEFWLQFHLEQESAGTSLDNLKKIVDRGIEALQMKSSTQVANAAVQELLLQHADACRRAASASNVDGWAQMREACGRAVALSEEQAAENGLACQALLHWMRLEAYGAQSAKEAMDIGNRLLKFWGGCYNVWTAFIAAVRYSSGNGSYSTVRDLFHRAMAQVSDYPSQIRTDYVQFERECGTFQSWREAHNADVELQKTSNEEAAVTAETSAQDKAKVTPQEGEATEDAQPGAKKRDKERVNVSGNEKKKRRRAKEAQAAAEQANAHVADQGDEKNNEVGVKASTDQSGVNRAAVVESSTDESAKSKVVKAEATTDKAADKAAEKAAKVQRLLAAAEKIKATTAKGKAEAIVEAEATKVPSVSHAQSPVKEAMETKTVSSTPAKIDSNTVPKQGGDNCKAQTTASSKSEAVALDRQEDVAQSQISKDTSGEAKTDAHQGSHYRQKRLAAGSGTLMKAEDEGKQTVYVANLDWSVDEAQLNDMFGEIPGLKEVRLVRDFLKRSKGYAYVDFEKSDQVDKAVKKMNGFSLNKRAMFVHRSVPTKPLFEERTIFVKNIGAETTESDIQSIFATKGEILGVRIPTDEDSGKHKGHAYVEFATADSTSAALVLDGTELGGKKICVARSIPMKDHRHQTAGSRKDIAQRANQKQIVDGKADRQDNVKNAENCVTTIYVKNLAFKVNEEKLRTHFAECGEVKQVMIVKNAKGMTRGFGFVEFANKEQAQAALAYNDSVLCGREIWVSKSQRVITLKGMKMGVAPDAATQAAEEKKAGPPQAGKRRIDLGDTKKNEEATDATDKEGAGEPAKKQFRSNKEGAGKAQVQVAVAEAAAPVVAAVAPQAEEFKPMSNTDFKKLLLGS